MDRSRTKAAAVPVTEGAPSSLPPAQREARSAGENTPRASRSARAHASSIEVDASEPALAAEARSRVEHPVVVVEDVVAGPEREAILVAGIADDAREAIVRAVPRLHASEREAIRREREVRVAD